MPVQKKSGNLLKVPRSICSYDQTLISIIIIIILFFSEFFTPALDKGFSWNFERQQVSLSLLDFSQYSSRSQ